MQRREFLSALALAAGTLALPGIAHSQAAKPKVIRLAGPGEGFGKPYGNLILGVVRVQGTLEKEFAEEGIDIQWDFPSGTGPAINEAFANGQLDFANYGGQPNISAKARGLNTKLLASYGNSNLYIAARKNLGAKSLKDLVGKKVGIARGTILQLQFGKVLAAQGLTEKDFKIFDLKPVDQVTALSSGDLDASVEGLRLLALQDQGIADIVYTTGDAVTPDKIFGGFLVIDDFAKAYPEITQRVVNVYVKAAHWASQEANRDALYDIWALTGAPRDLIKRDADGLPLKDRNSPLLTQFVREQYRSGIAFLFEQKIIRKDVDLDGWIDTSFLDKALADQKLAGFWADRAADGSVRS